VTSNAAGKSGGKSGETNDEDNNEEDDIVFVKDEPQSAFHVSDSPDVNGTYDQWTGDTDEEHWRGNTGDHRSGESREGELDDSAGGPSWEVKPRQGFRLRLKGQETEMTGASSYGYEAVGMELARNVSPSTVSL